MFCRIPIIGLGFKKTYGLIPKYTYLILQFLFRSYKSRLLPKYIYPYFAVYNMLHV